MKFVFGLVFAMVISIAGKSQSTPFTYQVQYSLIDTEYTSGDSLYSASAMMHLNGLSNIANIELKVGTVLDSNDVFDVSIPYVDGGQVTIFPGGTNAMVRVGNVHARELHYAIRLEFQDGTFSTPVKETTTAN